MVASMRFGVGPRAGRGSDRTPPCSGDASSDALRRRTYAAPVPERTATSPMIGTERLLIDGTNLLYAIRRGPFPAPAAPS